MDIDRVQAHADVLNIINLLQNLLQGALAMHLTKRRWTLLGEEIAGMLRSHPELDAEVMRGLILKLREWDNRENAKEQLWGVAVGKTLAPLSVMPLELDELSLEEHALILASFRVVARSWEEGVQPMASEER